MLTADQRIKDSTQEQLSRQAAAVELSLEEGLNNTVGRPALH
jgi:hypothetical protein